MADKQHEYRSTYYATHKDELREYGRAYYAKHKDKWRAYYAKNRERILGSVREYQANNTELIRNRWKSYKARYNNAKGNAKARRISFNLSFDEYIALVQDAVWHYCGDPLPVFGSGLDRRNNDPSYSVETVVPCCTECNMTFGAMYSYPEKLIIASARKHILGRRQHFAEHCHAVQCYGQKILTSLQKM